MAYAHRLPIVSSTAGVNSDGSLIGSINESQYLGVFTDVQLAASVYALTFNNTGGTNYTVGDASTAAGNDTVDDFLPFGATADMSANDFCVVACDVDIESIFVQVSTVGNYVGSITLHDSTNGTLFDRQLAITSDGTNSFKTSGINQIKWTAPASARVAFSPFPLAGVASRNWIKIGLTGLGSVTTAPRLARLWLMHTSGSISYFDLTSQANGDTAVAPTSTSFFPTEQSSVYYCTANSAIGEERYIFKKQANVRTRVVEFLTTSGWQAGTVTDPSADFTNGPATTTTPATKYAVRWTPPAGWTAQPPPFTLPVGAAPITSGFWRRIRTTAVTTLGPTDSVQSRVRARQFGNDNTSGVECPVAITLRAVTIDSIGSTVSGSGANTLQLANLTTGASASFDIPATPT